MSYKILKIYPDVMQDPRLKSLEERVVVCHILGFQQDNKCVFSTNAHISILTGLHEHEVQELIISLDRRKIIRIHWPTNGTARQLAVRLPGEPETFCEPGDIFDIYSEI